MFTPAEPTATILPSCWMATPEAPPSMATRTRPSPEKAGSRSPGVAEAGRAMARTRAPVTTQARTARRGVIERLLGSGEGDARSDVMEPQPNRSVERWEVVEARP